MFLLRFVILAISILSLDMCCQAMDGQDRKEEKGISPTGFNSYDRESDEGEDSLDAIRLSRRLEIATKMKQGFQAFFIPLIEADARENQKSETNFQQVIGLVTALDPNSLLAQASGLVGQVSSDNPALKSSEYKALMDLIVCIGMQERPEYFLGSEHASADERFAIGFRFLQEFALKGPLDRLVSLFKNSIESKEAVESKRAACLEFIDGITDVIKCIASGQDPLNRYVDSEDIKRVEELRELLEKNRGHREYDQYQREFGSLYKRILSKREQALEEGAKYMRSLITRMVPEPNTADQWKIRQRQEFENYVLKEYENKDIFEPNHLRSFWEELYRKQYGELFYKIVCENFEIHNKDNLLHQVVYQIWCVSHLDTINEIPQEARSRMPNASIEGTSAPNFGYRMEGSEAYRQWLENSFPRACGDIIMDAFHSTVDLGRNLDIDQFLDRLKASLSGAKSENYGQNPHKYDSFIIPFELFLLEKVFHEPFVRGENRTIPKELKKAAKEETNLLKQASEALGKLKAFTENMFDLRPGNGKGGEKDLLGLVFGIGFNGDLFDSPNHSQRNDNEIWLSFSESGRKSGGYLFLSFLKHIATRRAEKDLEGVAVNVLHRFDGYKSLMRHHLGQEIRRAYEVPDFTWDGHMLEYMQKERTRLEGFMSQLEQEIPFKHLNSELKKWISDISNWYHIPSEFISIQIPEKMPIEEYEAQEVARNLLFDALTGCQFSRKYPELMPFSFLHWKQRIGEQINVNDPKDVYTIQSVKNIKALPARFKDCALAAIDQIITQVHPILRSTWQPVIEKEFHDFIKSKTDGVAEKIRELESRINGIKKSLKNLSKATSKTPSDVFSKIKEAERDLKEVEQSKQQAEVKLINCPTKPADLSEEDYKTFRHKFFEGRNVSQCIEPVLARVLGHDRFFPVFISKKVGKTGIKTENGQRPFQLGNRIPQDVIAPCNKKCQHHVLGHLYVGDMLSYQSADRLDQIRQTHSQGEVPDRFLIF
jgi:hypothetical protein